MDRRNLWWIGAVVALVLGGMGTAGFRATARATDVSLNVDIGFFYDRLAPYGDWSQNEHYGWVWSPYGMPIGWRPYTDGHWVYTDDYGWLWDSDFDWGWACFHYGRWDWDDQLGWFWVPGYHWGPAWVAWRRGENFVGWVALPPQVRWQVGVGLEFNNFNLDEIPPRNWVFVQAGFFDEPHMRAYELLPYRNVTIFPETRNATRFEIFNGHIMNAGISVGWIEGRIHRPIRHFHVRHVESAGALRLPRERDGEISIFNPRIRQGPVGLAPPRPGEIERRQRAERSQLEERQRAETFRQEQRHQAERVAPGVNAEQLRQRQENEQRALRNEHERQYNRLNNEQRRERERFQRPPAEAGRTRERAQRPSAEAGRTAERPGGARQKR